MTVNDEMNLAAIEIKTGEGPSETEALALAVVALGRTQHTANLLTALTADNRHLLLSRRESHKLAEQVRHALGLPPGPPE